MWIILQEVMAQQQSAATVNTAAQQGLHQIITTPMQINNIAHQQPKPTDSGMIQSFNQHVQSNNQQNIITTQQQQIITTSSNLPVNSTFSNSTGSVVPSKSTAPNPQPGAATAAAQSSNDGTVQLLSKARLMDLVRDVDPTVQLDEEVEDLLLSIAECYVETIAYGATKIAKHRHVGSVGVSDVQLYLEQTYNIWIPGFGTDELRPFKRATVTEAHKQRMSLIRKARKN